MRNDIGKVRRSAVLANFAPGAVADFRAGRAAISGVVAGLEEWDRSAKPPGLLNRQVVHEARLERKLGVKGFRLPLVIDEDYKDDNGNGDPRRLVASRMPRWLQCPECDRIGPAQFWNAEPGKAERYCAQCTGAKGPSGRIFCVPVRFVMACQHGHLDDFPWHYWVNHKDTCNRPKFLKLESRGAGLSGLVVSCDVCKAERNMEGVFSVATWKKQFKCSGHRPWLAVPNEDCGGDPRAVQRGASNLYFSVISSALSIPPWSDELQEELGYYWDPIVQVQASQRAQFIETLGQSVLRDFLALHQMTPAALAAEIQRRLDLLERPETLDIRGEEYQQLTVGSGDPAKRSKEFECRPEKVPDALKPYFDRFVRVVRLREVRALKGFTRINPPGDEDAPGIARLSAQPLDWLPGIEVRGEGIFVELAAKRVLDWESDSKVQERALKVHGAWVAEWRSRHGDDPLPYSITPRYLLVHTFAHVLMRQLTLDCGYSSAALRERLYIRGGDIPMAAVLIYTSTSDADGTLGGLQRQGEARRLELTVPAALRAVEWCSSDPLCISDMLGGSDFLTLAACHACSMVPETSCETFNRFLDRGVLLGVPDASGYFQSLMET